MSENVTTNVVPGSIIVFMMTVKKRGKTRILYCQKLLDF